MENTNFKMMLLDDDEAFVDAVEQLINSEGYDCKGFTDVDEAMGQLKNRENGFKILVVDYLMVGITALSIIEDAKKIDPSLYIILLTGFPQNMPGLYALRNLEIDAYCRKSTDFTDLLVAIETGIKSLKKSVGEGESSDSLRFHERLRKLRVEMNMTQEDIGEYIGVGRTTVVNYEQGRIRPTLENVVKLARLFGVSCDYLMCDGFSDGLETS